MKLYLDTTGHNLIVIALKNKNRLIVRKKISSARDQAEKLLPAVEKLLKAAGVKPADLKKIEVASRGGSFTSLRVGVVTANALGYALAVPVKASEKSEMASGRFSVVKPLYGREPEITAKKR